MHSSLIGISLFAIALLPSTLLAQNHSAKPDLDGLDAFVESALKDWKVPGTAIAIIQDGKVILSKGYGLRNVKQNLSVTPKTIFAIGSATKSFTVLSLATLVDQGKLDWDKPVREYLPAFRLNDQFATDRMTPRDLVTHRSGLPRHDLVWYNSPLTRQEIFDRLRYLEPSRDFRTTFQYQNLMFMTAGYLAARVADMPWEDYARRSIFTPLGMTSSNFSVNDSQKSPDYALPYNKVKEQITEVAFRNIDTIGPAGSINSNVDDMIKYVQMHLSKGKIGSKQITSEANITQMQTPQMVIPGTIRHKELSHSSYGMGLFVTSYRGRKLVHHGGNIDGFSALVTFMPQDNIGMVILTNMNGSVLPTVLSYNVYDRLLGLDQIGWTARLKEDERLAQQSQDEAKKRGLTAQRPNTHPSHELKDYAGDFEHPGYGVAKVALDGDRLTFTFNGLTGNLKHYHYDIFEVEEAPLNPLQKSKVMFHTNLQGDIDSVASPIESTVKEIVFTRMGDRSMMERTFLQPLAGTYMLGAGAVVVALEGDKRLTLTLPGQPTYDLIGQSGTKFSVKGLTGYTVEFKKNDAGAIAELVFYQPNGTFVAKRK